LPNLSTSKLFADDLKSYTSLSSIVDKVFFQQTIDAVSDWSTLWQLPLSVGKCNWMLLTNRPQLDLGQFVINGAPLAPVFETKDLGVIFNANLNFSNHINSIISRAKQRLFLIRKCFVSSDWTTLIIAFKTYILPILEYCSQVKSPPKRY
jgi:hypothetical protein